MLKGLREEMLDHIERETRENIGRGMAPDEARREAMRRFGSVTLACEDTRAVWYPVWLEQLRQDARYAARSLRRNPGFSAVVVLTLALGIGMNTAVLSVVNSALLRPLPYPDAARLVWLSDFDYLYDHRDNYVSRPAYLAWREHARSFDAIAAFGNQDLALLFDGVASQERIASVTGEFWPITGGRAVLGRLFAAGEDHAIVLSHALFERRFGADPAVIGKSVSINGHAFAIAGVLPPDFRFLFPQQYATGDEVRGIDAYIAIPAAAMRAGELSIRPWEEALKSFGPAAYNLRVAARLRAGVSMEQGRAEMETVYANAKRGYPDYRAKHVRLGFVPLEEKLKGESRRPLLVLLGAVGFVLLIACANTANLLLARASARAREIAIRTAIGAGRARMIRQFVTESVVLALCGGAAGLLVAAAAITVFAQLSPLAAEAALDGRVLGATLAVSVAAGIAFGLAPALLKVDLGRRVLVAGELALAVVLLTGAGLMLKSFWRMNANAPGFAPESILVMRVALSGPNYATWLQKQAYIDRLLGALSGAAGVQSVGLDCGTMNSTVRVGAEGREQGAGIRAVSPGYLRAMGVQLLRGRWPEHGDLRGVLVNESFARGRKLTGERISGSVLSDEIIGVVADFKYRALDAEPTPEIYFPYERFPLVRSIKVVTRVAGRSAAVAPLIRELAAGIDRTQPPYEFQTLEQALAESIAPRRFNLVLLEAFAATALLLSLIGIYGVIAFTVSRRTREIGIRLAVGAQRTGIVGMVVRDGMALAFTGIAAGSIAAVGLTRGMASMLYGVEPHDPAVFTGAALLLAGAALLASAAPALRAALIDPLIALRHD